MPFINRKVPERACWTTLLSALSESARRSRNVKWGWRSAWSASVSRPGAADQEAPHGPRRMVRTMLRISDEAQTKELRDVASQKIRRQQLASPTSRTAKFVHPRPESLA